MQSDRIAPPGTSLRGYGQSGVALQAGDDAAVGRVQPGPPAVVVVAEVEHVGGARLDRHLVRRGDVVDVASGEGGINRLVRVGIVDHVHLGAADLGGEARPVGAELVQPPRWSRSDRWSSHGAAQAAMGPLHHEAQEVGEHRGRPVGVGIGQGSARRPAGAQVVGRASWLCSPGLDFAQARGARQLAVQQRHQLALRRQPADSRISRMGFYHPVEHRPRNVLKNTMKYAILMPHGAGPRFVSGNVWQRPGPSRINAMRFVHKNRTGQPWDKPGYDGADAVLDASLIRDRGC